LTGHQKMNPTFFLLIVSLLIAQGEK